MGTYIDTILKTYQEHQYMLDPICNRLTSQFQVWKTCSQYNYTLATCAVPRNLIPPNRIDSPPSPLYKSCPQVQKPTVVPTHKMG